MALMFSVQAEHWYRAVCQGEVGGDSVVHSGPGPPLGFKHCASPFLRARVDHWSGEATPSRIYNDPQQASSSPQCAVLFKRSRLLPQPASRVASRSSQPSMGALLPAALLIAMRRYCGMAPAERRSQSSAPAGQSTVSGAQAGGRALGTPAPAAAREVRRRGRGRAGLDPPASHHAAAAAPRPGSGIRDPRPCRPTTALRPHSVQRPALDQCSGRRSRARGSARPSHNVSGAAATSEAATGHRSVCRPAQGSPPLPMRPRGPGGRPTG
ncbi:hypothetical protein NDU88_006112 [Pleurodeles waltl]|uniref:Uncharacterized protein n=1 Tax=Pleurodeles waltl TaxID=8319 RepID=A0AAV7SNQ1_PLEWA|nr:hypothetical protein NDU88_006112 [Pleurodeles waltl]